MGKQWIVGLFLLGIGATHTFFLGHASAFAQAEDSSVSDALPLDEANAAPGAGAPSDDGVSVTPPPPPPALGEAQTTVSEEPPAAPYEPPPTDAKEFAPPPSTAENVTPEPTVKVHPNDENIEYNRVLRRLEMQELPKGYRHHALGTEGYRPNTIAIGTGGRIPGIGVLFDYSWNRVGVGVSFSYRPEHSFSRIKNDPDVAKYGQTFGNVWIHYNWIPFPVSPYVLVGVEVADKTQSRFNAIGGIGIEARFWRAATLFVEYVRHETAKEGFPGAALGWAF